MMAEAFSVCLSTGKDKLIVNQEHYLRAGQPRPYFFGDRGNGELRASKGFLWPRALARVLYGIAIVWVISVAADSY